MRAFFGVFMIVLGLSSTFAGDERSLDEHAARSVGQTFIHALERADVGILKSILPVRGKVRLRLMSLGPNEGVFSPSQVQALLQDFLRRGSVSSPTMTHVEVEANRHALVHLRARVTDLEGRSSPVTLYLTLQPEGGRWVLREVRENPA